MKLHITKMSRIDGRGGSLRGEVEVVFGEPLRFDADMDAATATTIMEAAVAVL